MIMRIRRAGHGVSMKFTEVAARLFRYICRRPFVCSAVRLSVYALLAYPLPVRTYECVCVSVCWL